MKKRLFAYSFILLSFILVADSCRKDGLDALSGGGNVEEKENGGKGQSQGGAEEPAGDTLKAISLVPGYKKVNTFPTVHITTDGGAPIPTRRQFSYVTGHIRFKDPEGMYSDTALIECDMKIRHRGNTSANYDKKPYRIKLTEKHHVFGMKPDKDWVLLAEFTDHSALRNTTATQISRLMRMDWTPDCRSAEVYLNGGYIGLYTIMEAKETGLSKVDIDPLAGEYLVEVDDKIEDDDVTIPGRQTRYFYKVVKFHDPEEPTEDQRNFVRDYMNNVEKLLVNNNFSETDGYRKYIDIESFAKWYLIEELIKNVDGNFRLSTYLAIHKNGKITMPFIWDSDLSLGNGDIYSGWYSYGVDNSSTGWFVRICGGRPIGWEDPNGQDGWFQHMLMDPAFVKEVKYRWNKYKTDIDSVPAYIDAMYEYVSGPLERNAERWQYGFDDHGRNTADMRNFLKERIVWMDKEINGL